jgi:hypothetical protein
LGKNAATIARNVAADFVVDDAATARAAGARQQIAEADRKLAGYRDALDAGADATVVASWIGEAQADRLAALDDLARVERATAPDVDELRALLVSLGDVRDRLSDLDLATKAGVYRNLGVSLDWQPGTDRAFVSVRPGVPAGRVGGASSTLRTRLYCARHFCSLLESSDARGRSGNSTAPTHPSCLRTYVLVMRQREQVVPFWACRVRTGARSRGSRRCRRDSFGSRADRARA